MFINRAFIFSVFKVVVGMTSISMVVLYSYLAFALPKEPDIRRNITRDELDRACDASGGIAWGTLADKGDYGCLTDNHLVICSGDGDCDVWLAESFEERKLKNLKTTLLVQDRQTESQTLPSYDPQACEKCPTLRAKIEALNSDIKKLSYEYKQLVEKISKGHISSVEQAFDAKLQLTSLSDEIVAKNDLRQLFTYNYMSTFSNQGGLMRPTSDSETPLKPKPPTTTHQRICECLCGLYGEVSFPAPESGCASMEDKRCRVSDDKPEGFLFACSEVVAPKELMRPEDGSVVNP